MTSAAHGQFIYANVGCVPGAAHDSWAWSQDSLCDKLRKPDEPWAGYLMAVLPVRARRRPKPPCTEVVARGGVVKLAAPRCAS